MKGFFKILFCALIVDFFYFSSPLVFTRGVNTKLILSVFGLATFIIFNIRRKEFRVSREMVLLTVLATGVSLASYLAMTINNTRDNTYLTYVVSMLVWLAAAYMMIRVLHAAHGKVTIEVVANYIIALSVIQCTIAILGNMFESVNLFIKMVYPGTGWRVPGRRPAAGFYPPG